MIVVRDMRRKTKFYLVAYVHHELGEDFKLRSEWDFLAVGLHCLVALHLK